MRAALAALGAAFFALAAPAPAQDAATSLPPRHVGYDFGNARVLAEQRLFGLAHGIALLAAACRAVPDAGPGAQDAYTAWRVRQQPTIDGIVAELGTHYFDNALAAAAAVARQMELRAALDYAPDAPELAAACATLPAALAQPRYDLAARLRLEEPMARIVAAATLEARDHYCRGKLGGMARQVHEARYAVWREFNAPLIEQSSAVLASGWPADAPAATFAAWLAELRRDTKVGGGEADCLAFSATLKQPETALRNAFRMPSPLHRASPP